MSVVGIDFGNQNCVISVARKGIVEIIVNEVSNRKTPSLVAFDGRERQLGEAAAVRMVSNATNTIDNIKRMLGRRFNDPDFQRDRKMFHFKTVCTDADHIAIEVNYMGEQTQFVPEQIAAALFGCLKRITEKALAPISVQDCVITIPSYFTDVQRRAILDAACLVGFNVLRLMHETTAVALQYGILRNLPEAAPFKVMFVDVGHSQTSVSVVSFVQGKLTVLGSDCDPNLGGRDFDAALLRRFVDDIQSKHGVDVTSSPKAMLRLAQIAERTKKMLSANHEAPWNVECLINDLDVRGIVTRQEFESTCTSLLERVLVPIKNLMHHLNLKQNDLHSVEIVGGTIRVPAVRATLENWFGRTCSTTCDGDESVARGAALMCAMLSPSFRVRDFDVQDVIGAGIEVAYGPVDGTLGDFTPLFPKYNAIPVTKMINFYRPEPFRIEARYSEHVVGVDPVIGSFKVSGIPQSTDSTKPAKSKVKVRLDLNGILSVPSATSVQEIEEAEPVAAVADAMPVDDAPKADVSGGASNQPAAMEEEGTPLPEGTAQPADQKMDVDIAPKKKQLKRTELQILSEVKGGLPSALFQTFFEKEVQMHNEDKIIFETLEKRNDLESYIYEMRDRTETDLSEFLDENTRSAFLEALNSAENWLYSEESEGAQKSTFIDQLNKLKATGDVAIRLQSEFEQREQKIAEALNLIQSYTAFVESQDEKWSHIAAEKKASVSSKCAELESWISNVTAKQERLSKCQQPAFTVAELSTKCKELSQFVEPIMRTPKPKPAPAPAPAAEPSKEPENKAGEGESSTMRDEEAPQNESDTKKESESCDPTQTNESMNVD